jgi:hypothetical protein
MENKIYNDDVERIVNDPERQQKISKRYERKRSNREKSILGDAVSYGLLAVTFAFLGVVGWLMPFIAFSIFAICGVLCAFHFGRWYNFTKDKEQK